MIRTEGRPYEGTEIRIVDDGGQPVPAGTVGNVIVNGPSRFLGFLHNPELTATSLDAAGFYRTGDLGTLDEDGHFTFVGRSKDIIRRGGVTILPAELEPVILRHPAVHDVAVVPLPDERMGERACAAIVPKAGSSAPTLEELQVFLDARGRRQVHVAGVDRGVHRLPADAFAEGGQARRRRADPRAPGGPGVTPGQGQRRAGDPARGHRALRARRLRGHQVGAHRRRRRRRADCALPLLRVQAALPVRDPRRGDRAASGSASPRSPRPTPTRSMPCGRSSRTASTSPSWRSCATACSSPSRDCSPAGARRRARSRRARRRDRARAISSSPTRASSPARCSRARSRPPTRGCSPARCSGSTTASGRGTGRTGSSRSSGSSEFYVERMLAVVGAAEEPAMPQRLAA